MLKDWDVASGQHPGTVGHHNYRPLLGALLQFRRKPNVESFHSFIVGYNGKRIYRIKAIISVLLLQFALVFKFILIPILDQRRRQNIVQDCFAPNATGDDND